MSTNKYKWLTLGLTSIVISGCAVGNKSHLNLGIADAFRKSKNCLLKKKLGYRAPATGATFGYANPVDHGVPVEDGVVTVVPDQSASIVSSDCSCNSSVSDSEFYMPVETAYEMVDPPVASDGDNLLPAALPAAALPAAALPVEASQDNSGLENPLPPAIEVPETPSTPSISVDPTEEEGIIETLDSASVDIDETKEDLKIIPEKDETSILDTAVMPLEVKTPTSAGQSVVEQRTKMLTLTARPVQSHQVADAQSRLPNKASMQQVTHKRHFRQQNALRPLHQKFRGEPLEYTAEAPGPLKFKPLPVMSKESEKKKTSDSNTGAPALKTSRSIENLDQSSSKTQRLPAPEQKLAPEAEKESVIKIARLPILKAESTSSAAIGSLRNFTNVRDLDPGFDKEYQLRKNAEAAALKAAQISADNLSEASDDLSIEH